jgi:hypothetical protein
VGTSGYLALCVHRRRPRDTRAAIPLGSTTIASAPTGINWRRRVSALADSYGTASYIETLAGRCFSIKLAKTSN